MTETESDVSPPRSDRQAQRNRDEFLAMLAHELRNPLAPITSALEILALRPDDHQTVVRAHEVIARQVHQLIRIVDDLLDIARIARGRIELRRARVELTEVVATAVETVRPLIESRKHRLETRSCGEFLWVEGDPARLAQVLVNLLNNAAKYTEEGGEISICSERLGDQAVVRIRDNGIGISADVLPSIFDLYAQAEPKSKRAMGGLGVGLALARQLVEMHGGQVRADSEGVGRGSEFTVLLPLALAPADVATLKAESHHPPGGQQRILIVEDDFDAAETLATMLRLWGHNVEIAHDGFAAVMRAICAPPDAMIVDIGLPMLDGCSVAARLRNHPAGRRINLIALTGFAQQKDRERAMQAGFGTFLVKPVNPELLRSVLGGLRLSVAQ